MILLLRFLAFSIDYVILAVYGCLLFLIASSSGFSTRIHSPWMSQGLALITLTIPVFLYFCFFETRKQAATPGKRLLGLQITHINNQPATSGQVALRNLIKFLPWEIAHTGVHWAYAMDQDAELPIWVWCCLIGAQILMTLFVGSALFQSHHQTVYDMGSNTKVIRSSKA